MGRHPKLVIRFHFGTVKILSRSAPTVKRSKARLNPLEVRVFCLIGRWARLKRARTIFLIHQLLGFGLADVILRGRDDSSGETGNCGVNVKFFYRWMAIEPIALIVIDGKLGAKSVLMPGVSVRLARSLPHEFVCD